VSRPAILKQGSQEHHEPILEAEMERMKERVVKVLEGYRKREEALKRTISQQQQVIEQLMSHPH